MTTWTTISAGLVAVGAKPFATTIQALRDNPIAISEGSSGSPVNSPGWHPYDMVNVGDGATGLFYTYTTDVANIVTPDFEDGYEYRIKLIDFSHDNGVGSQFLRVELYRETDAAYGDALQVSASTSGATLLTAVLDLTTVRETAVCHAVLGWSSPQTSGSPSATSVARVCARAAQKRLRARISWDANDIDGGLGYLYRRRNFISG